MIEPSRRRRSASVATNTNRWISRGRWRYPEWAPLRLAGAAPRDGTVGQLTSFSVCERLIS